MTEARSYKPRLAYTGAYVVCPASEFLHDGIAIPVYPSTKKRHFTAVCPCNTRVWCSALWTPDQGLTAQGARDHGLVFEQRYQLDQALSEVEGERFIVCPHSGQTHQGLHAVKVKRGPKTFHAECGGTCLSQVFLGPRWGPLHGLTRQIAEARGCTFSE